MSLKHPSPSKRQPIQKTIIALSLALVALGLYVVIKKPTLTPPAGIRPLKSVDLHQIEGPWFEVARLSSPIEDNLKFPSLFIRYSGSRREGLWSYADPDDPRFRIELLGMVSNEPKKIISQTVTDRVKDYKVGTLSMPCWGFIRCAYHLIAYYEDHRSWMVVAGAFKNQLWIFSRAPGLVPDALKNIQKTITGLGYDAKSFTYSNELPRVPEIVPTIPDVIPEVPAMPTHLPRDH